MSFCAIHSCPRCRFMTARTRAGRRRSKNSRARSRRCQLPSRKARAPGAEQLERVGHARPAWPGDGRARRLLVGSLVLLPERDEQLALAAEVVVQAAHARPGPLDHVGDAGLGEALLGEDLAGGVEQRPLRLRGASPLPGAPPGFRACGSAISSSASSVCCPRSIVPGATACSVSPLTDCRAPCRCDNTQHKDL